MIDLDPQRAAKFSEGIEARASTDVQDVIADPNIDIAVVVTHAETHHTMTKSLLDAGKHVLCEKPYSMNLDDIREAKDVVQRTGGKLRVGFIMRQMASLDDLVQKVRAGELGRPIYYRHYLHQRPDVPGAPNSWNTLRD